MEVPEKVLRLYHLIADFCAGEGFGFTLPNGQTICADEALLEIGELMRPGDGIGWLEDFDLVCKEKGRD